MPFDLATNLLAKITASGFAPLSGLREVREVIWNDRGNSGYTEAIRH